MVSTFSRLELTDMRADARADYQHARRMGNQAGMALAVSDMNAIDIELATSNNITVSRVELAH